MDLRIEGAMLGALDFGERPIERPERGVALAKLGLELREYG